jgi:hypothetical protein
VTSLTLINRDNKPICRGELKFGNFKPLGGGLRIFGRDKGEFLRYFRYLMSEFAAGVLLLMSRTNPDLKRGLKCLLKKAKATRISGIRVSLVLEKGVEVTRVRAFSLKTFDRQLEGH